MDTSAARRAIFNRIRAAQNRPSEPTLQERQNVQEYLARHPSGPRPAIGSDLTAHFKEQAIRMSDTVHDVKAWEEVPMAVARYLESIGAPKNAIAWKTLAELPWTQAGLQVEFRPPKEWDVVGITGTFCAIAETGTLMQLSGPNTYASANFLPQTHVAIVPQSRIVPSMEDAFALMRAECGELPRATNFISGPSRTADIEQSVVLGAHGPYRVHVILVQNA